MELMTACAGDHDNIYNLANLPNPEPLISPRLAYLDCDPTDEKCMEITFVFLRGSMEQWDVQREDLYSSGSVTPQL